MTLGELLQAYALVSGVHTAGHFDEANRQGLPIRLNPSSMVEEWGKPTNSKNDSSLNGAGFNLQDRFSTRANTPAIDIANAIYKVLYASGATMAGKNLDYKGGDIEAVKDKSGNKYTKELLLSSALADLVRSQQKEPNWNMRFHVTDGSPGLMLDYRW